MRHPKPFFRNQTQSWYVKVSKRFVPLGKDESKAWEKYYAIMGNRLPTTPDTKVEQLLGKFLTWVEKHRALATYEWYVRYLASFRNHVGSSLTVINVKPFHVTEWLDAIPGGDNHKNGAARAVMRAFNWAVKEGHLGINPVRGVERPPAHGRVAYLTPVQWRAVMEELKDADPFKDFLSFLRETGCRPQEARHAEARHFDPINKQLLFPVKEAKGKREPRIIPLNEKARAIIARLALANPDGKLFRNAHGNPWKCFSLNCRCAKLRKKLGFKIFPYAVRHTFITDALLRGVDPVTLAHIVGHKDATMILKIYQHIHLNTGHVRHALALATGEIPPVNRCTIAKRGTDES